VLADRSVVSLRLGGADSKRATGSSASPASMARGAIPVAGFPVKEPTNTRFSVTAGAPLACTASFRPASSKSVTPGHGVLTGQLPDVELQRGRGIAGRRRGRNETRKGWPAAGKTGLFAFVGRLATMTFALAVRRPKNIVL